jgi:hypothetical protein
MAEWLKIVYMIWRNLETLFCLDWYFVLHNCDFIYFKYMYQFPNHFDFTKIENIWKQNEQYKQKAIGLKALT